MAEVAPYATAGDEKVPLRIKTAIFMTLRNEDPERAIARLRTVKASVDATGEGAAFGYFVLSDTNNPDVAVAEEQAVAAWKAADPDRERIIYRRRTDNTGYKAGNVRDFCARWGGDYALMLPLDADSLMAGDQIVRLVRMMQAYPKIGILQSLVVGMPSSSAFARIFQFGMRHGMRSYTMGQAWWVGDCGPFWGHNALVRIKPFHEECHLPILPGKPPLGGHVLSHDQVEATLDAPRRLRGARAARGARQVGGEPADHAGVRPSRRALVPGQHAIRQAARPARALPDEPLPAGVGDPDVRRHSGLDADDRAAAGGGLGVARHCRFPGRAGRSASTSRSSPCT